MEDGSKKLVITFVIFNTIITFSDTLTQILHYILTVWVAKDIQNIALVFLLLKPILHLFMFLIYFLCHYEKLLTFKRKIIVFVIYILSVYIGYTPGVHASFFSKYYLESENGIVITKVVNIFTFVLVTLPKFLIIPINSSSRGEWEAIDIVAFIFSCIFILWNIIYYIICIYNDLEFELELEEMSRMWMIETNQTTDNISESKNNYFVNNYNLKNFSNKNVVNADLIKSINSDKFNINENNTLKRHTNNSFNINKQDINNDSFNNKNNINNNNNIELNDIKLKDKSYYNNEALDETKNKNKSKFYSNSTNINIIVTKDNNSNNKEYNYNYKQDTNDADEINNKKNNISD